VNAYATSKTQADAVNWANAQIGKSLDQDGVYGAQCVDLIRYYYQFLGVSPVSGNGCDYAKNSLPSGWQRIKTYNGFVPQPGDIAVWTYASSAYGHVAIITSADSSKMNVVEQNGSTHITRSHFYSYSYGTFYGVIRPNFASSGSTAKGEMTIPNIHINGNTFYTGSSIRITWDATSVNTDFYQYWLIIRNTTINVDCYVGSAGSDGNPSKNYYDFKISTSGSYLITVYAVPHNNKDSRQKASTRTFVANTNEMAIPTISINKANYHVGNTVCVNWTPSSSNTDFNQYWIIIKNNTNGKECYGGSAGSDGNPLKNYYDLIIPNAGNYTITVYAVPHYNKDKRQKAATKTFTAYAEHQYNSGQVTKPATCEQAGVKTYTCTVCGAAKTESIAKLSHQYSWNSVGGVLVNSCDSCGTEKNRLPFEDLNGYEGYGDYIAYTSAFNKFISGTNPPYYTEFSPTKPIIRAMLVAILYRMAGNPYDNGKNPYRYNPFTDVGTGAYYYNAACWALDKGITNQTTFKPNDNVTREQTARFLFNYAENTGRLGSSNYKKVNLKSYPDYGSVHSWAEEPLQWANYNNMMNIP